MLVVAAACGWNAAGSTRCSPEDEAVVLPDGLREASGAAWSTPRRGIVWSHNDSGAEPVLFAVDAEGRELARVPLSGARNVDWEALARGDCPEGTCLYVGDLGDNQGRRTDPAIYRLPEPPPTPDAVAARRLPVRYPDGPRDAEALFALPGEELYVVTKGRLHPVTVYRYPTPLRPDEPVTLEEVQRLGDRPRDLARQVTGASAEPDGRIVAIRTYGDLAFHRMEEGRLVPLAGARVDLATLREAQGEAVALEGSGRVALLSEAGPAGRAGGLRFLRCPGTGAGG